MDMNFEPKNAAQAASFNSIKNVKAKNKTGWLDLFDDNAIVEDPVGESPLDTTGNGHQGKDAIAAFWDIAIAIGEIEFELIQTHPCGNECANVAHLTKKLSDEIAIETDLVIVYRVNDAGKIISLRAFWDYAIVQAQLDKAFA